MNAPKKIWVHKKYGNMDRAPLIPDQKFIPYIRADIFDELVEAIKEAMEFNESYWKIIDFSPSNNGAFREITNKVEAALKKLEDV